MGSSRTSLNVTHTHTHTQTQTHRGTQTQTQTLTDAENLKMRGWSEGMLEECFVLQVCFVRMLEECLVPGALC